MEMCRRQAQGPCYVSRDDHEHKFRARKQRADIGIYRFVNRTFRLCTQLPAEALATFSCKSNVLEKMILVKCVYYLRCTVV